MKRLLVLATLILASNGCMQTENSSALDAGAYSDAGSAEFVAVKTIMSQSCVPCHSYHTRTEAELATDGLLVKGDPEASKIYYRLVGSTGALGPKSMPTGGALDGQQIEQVATWIIGIQ